jgi:hypothetical protein
MMRINLFPLLYLWLALDAIIIVLFGCRQTIARKEEGSLHVLSGTAEVAHQVGTSQKLDQIDKWGKLLTIVAVAFGVLLGALAIYQSLTSAGSSGV